VAPRQLSLEIVVGYWAADDSNGAYATVTFLLSYICTQFNMERDNAQLFLPLENLKYFSFHEVFWNHFEYAVKLYPKLRLLSIYITIMEIVAAVLSVAGLIGQSLVGRNKLYGVFQSCQNSSQAIDRFLTEVAALKKTI
jgi:hypothetical protein